MPAEPRIGYVAKVFPRLSETFVVTELLGHERAGLDVEVFSLRPSADRGAHAAHARLRAPVTELPQDVTVGALLDAAAACAQFADVGAALDDARELSPRELLQALTIARLVRERRITRLHAHFANVAAVVTRVAARLAGVPYTLTTHAKDIFCDDVDRAALDGLLGDAAAVVTVSDFNVAHLAAAHPGVAGRIHRVYNGIELDAFAWQAPERRPPRIVGVGRLVEKKGFGDLLAACAILRDAGRTFDCRIVGAGVLAEDLQANAATLGLQDVVTFTGAASQEQVRAEITGAAVLAAPCVVAGDGNRDGLPTVLLEAMALGTPCVATPVTGIPEVLVDGVTGLQVPPRRPEALAGALAALLDDAGARVRLSRTARARIEADFDVDRTTARWREIVLGQEARDAHRVRLR